MSVQRNNFSDIYLIDALPVLNALIFDEHDKQPDMVPMIFRDMPSNQWGEQTTTIAGVKAAPVKLEGDTAATDDPLQGYDKTYTHVTYAIQTSFTREAIDDNKLSLVEDTYRSLGMSAHQTKQIVCFNIFNNAFTDTGPDGSTLCATHHAMIGGHTYGNRPTSDIALSVGGIREMRVAMLRQVNHRNINVVIQPKFLLVPPELSDTAIELTKSMERPDTANRAINSFAGKYDPIVSPYLTSTTAWWAVSDKSQHQLRFYNREAPNTDSWIDRPTRSVQTMIAMRFSAGYSDFLGTWGTIGG